MHAKFSRVSLHIVKEQIALCSSTKLLKHSLKTWQSYYVCDEKVWTDLMQAETKLRRKVLAVLIVHYSKWYSYHTTSCKNRSYAQRGEQEAY